MSAFAISRAGSGGGNRYPTKIPGSWALPWAVYIPPTRVENVATTIVSHEIFSTLFITNMPPAIGFQP